MTVTYFPDVVQGSEEWHAQRIGYMTASEMSLFITPTLKQAKNDKTRAHVYELAAQRISLYVEPSYVGDAMLRGWEEEAIARQHYAAHYAPVQEVGFVTNSSLGFTVGYSPDGLVGENGLIEIKSRRQKFQVETLATGIMPVEFSIQVQTGLWVTGREWCDFVSFSGGLPMAVIRIEPDPVVRAAIIEAATEAEAQILAVKAKYDAAITAMYTAKKLIPTERRVIEEMHL